MTNGVAQLQALEQEIIEIGQHIPLLLKASSFTPEEQEAWLVVIPQMSYQELEKFLEMLELNITRRAKEEVQDVLVQAQARAHAYNLQLHTSVAQAQYQIDNLHDEVVALERAGGKQ